MYPDLVRSSRFNLHFQQGKLAVSAFNLFSYLPVRHGLTPRPALTCATCSHARATDDIAANRGGDGPFCHLGPAVHQGDIRLLYLATRELLSQLSVSKIRLGY